MSRELVRRCPLCANGLGTVRHTQRIAVPEELGVADTFDVVTCDRCGFAFADLPTTQGQLDRSYEQHSKYADEALIDETAYSDPPWDADRLRDVATWLAGQIGDRTTRVLDAGCAGGSFLGLMKERGFDALVGIDPSPRATAIARRRHHVEALAGSFLALPPELGTFGLVTLQHTLEHLRDVRPAVAALRDTLDDNGLAYVEVPDAAHYADTLVAPFHDFNTEHINHFSSRLLNGVMCAEGFVPVSIGEKTIMASRRHRYPAAYGLWRKSGLRREADVARDPDFVAEIVRYVDASQQLMTEIDRTLRAALAHDAEVVVWGTGQLAFKLATDTVLADKRITFVDGSPEKQGMHIGGNRILAPDAVARDARPIVVGSILSSDAIVGAIRHGFGDTRRIVRLPEGGATPAQPRP